jgi:predicted DNA binding CopG/RHH family protein
MKKMEQVNATIRISKQDWEALKQKAQNLGMNRTKLLTLIARGEITVEKIFLEEELLLGES